MNARAYAAPASPDMTIPPIAPSQVLFGLVLGAIFLLPIAFPTRRPPTSVNLAVRISQTARSKPSFLSLVRLRVRTIKLRAKGMHRIPKSVTATFLVIDDRLNSASAVEARKTRERIMKNWKVPK